MTDVLSEVLRVVKLDAALFFNGEFSAPWCLSQSRAPEIAHFISSHAEHLIIYHFLTEGHAYAQLQEGEEEAKKGSRESGKDARRVELEAGDIVIFPHGDAHYLGNGLSVTPLDSFKTFKRNLSEGLKLARLGGGGEVTRFVCGFMACEPRLSEVLLAGLPKIFKVRITDEPSDQWLENSIRFSVGESDGSDGSRLVLAKLSELLFVETLRRYISGLPVDQIGWLAGARDPSIGEALALIHKDPEHPWTVAQLARRVGLSRTRFAERFQHFLGESPIAYLSKWRLKLGADLLQSTEDSVAEVAIAVGYGSEAAFNRAFKREFNCPPAQFRRSRRQGD